MFKLILRRLLLGVATVGLVSLIIFGAVEALPGSHRGEDGFGSTGVK